VDTAGIEALLDSLNSEQRAAANVGPGRLALAGCPGSGKTRTIVARIARMVKEGYPAEKILAMTFTKRAAATMNERLAYLGIEGTRVGTIHSVCFQILQAYLPMMETLKLSESGFGQQIELKKIVQGRKRRRAISPRTAVDISNLQRYIADNKARGATYLYGNLFGRNEQVKDGMLSLAEKWTKRTGLAPVQLYNIYCDLESVRGASGWYDYDDMMNWAWQVLTTDDAALARWRSRWSVIIVDEAQDQTPIQWDLAFLLAGMRSRIVRGAVEMEPPHNLMVALDISQSLYAWRSAEPDIALDFATAEETRLIRAPRNYRSGSLLCEVASDLVHGEPWHLGGRMVSEKNGSSGAVEFMRSDHILLEAAGAVAWCIDRAEEAGTLRGCAILSRLSAILHLAEIECARRGIPYIKRAGGSFVDAKEVQDILAYIRVAAKFDPDGRAAKRALKAPFRKLGNQLFADADRMFSAKGGRISYAECLLLGGGMGHKQRRAIMEFEDLIEDLEGYLDAPGILVERIVRKTGYLNYLREDRGMASVDSSKAAILEELEWLGSLFDTAQAFLSWADQMAISMRQHQKALARADQVEEEALVLSTVHSAKGLEWNYVALCDMVQGRCPWNLGYSQDEERRIAYVGFTRAAEGIRISWSGAEKAPSSPFVAEIYKSLHRLLGASESLENSGDDPPG